MAHITAAYILSRDLTALSKDELIAKLTSVDARISTLQQVIFSQTAAVTHLTAKVTASETENALLLSETEGKIQLLTEQIAALTVEIKELSRKAALAERISEEKIAADRKEIDTLKGELAAAGEDARSYKAKTELFVRCVYNELKITAQARDRFEAECANMVFVGRVDRLLSETFGSARLFPAFNL